MKLISIQDLYFLSVIILIKALSLSPSAKLKESVTNSIAYFAYHVSRKKRRLSEKNISETLQGEITESRKQEIVKGNFYEFWKDTLSLSPSDNEKAALKRVELRGIGHLRKALEKERESFYGRTTVSAEETWQNRSCMKKDFQYTRFTPNAISQDSSTRGIPSPG